MNVTTKTTHSRVRNIRLDSKELSKLVAEAVAKQIDDPFKIRLDSPGVTYVVKFEDEMHGSPAYKTGTAAIIIISEDLSPQASEQ